MSELVSPFTPVKSILNSTEPPVTWLVPDFLPQGTLIALAGEPGAGKSYLAYTLGVGLATGTDVLGWPLTAQSVLYVDQENSLPDFKQYLKWAWKGLGSPDQDLLEQNFHHAHFKFGHAQWQQRLIEYAQLTQPKLIIIDTTTPVCNVQDENDNAEAARIINQFRGVQTVLTPWPTILALKHSKLKTEGGGYTLRGAKSWEGQVDGVVYHIRGKGANRNDGLRATHLEPSKTRAFGLREMVKINPQWTENRAGLKLTRTF